MKPQPPVGLLAGPAGAHQAAISVTAAARRSRATAAAHPVPASFAERRPCGPAERSRLRQLAFGVPLRGRRGGGRAPDRLSLTGGNAGHERHFRRTRRADAASVASGRTDSRRHGRRGLERDRDGAASRLRARPAAAPAERGGRVGEHGAGAGGCRPGRRRSLASHAGCLRACCAGAPRPNRCRTACGRCAHDPASRKRCQRSICSNSRQTIILFIIILLQGAAKWFFVDFQCRFLTFPARCRVLFKACFQ